MIKKANTSAGHSEKIFIPNGLKQDEVFETNQQSTDRTATNNITNEMLYTEGNPKYNARKFQAKEGP
jgi:hypothetical protein